MTEAERERYSRQILFSGIGEAGQDKLRRASVAVAGCGALGSFHVEALARAGVGRLIVVDRDYVEFSNLQRQWLFTEADAQEALPKAVAAARAVSRINSGVEIRGEVADLGPSNIEELFEGVSVVLDGLDNFETRYLINDWAVRCGVPWIYGAAVSSYGIVMPVIPGRASCLKCVYPNPPSGAQPTCETAGVLNTVTAAIAALQCSLALKILVGGAEAIESRITTIDVWTGVVRQIAQPLPAADCPACALRSFHHLEGRDQPPVSLCGRNAVQIHERRKPLDLAELAVRLGALGVVRVNDFALRFSVAPYEMTIFPDGRAIIKGTTDTGIARSLYARYIGA